VDESGGFVEVEGRKLSYEVTGEGPAVVLVHSAIADKTLWDAQVEALAPRFRVVRYDVAGFGQSPLRPGPFSHVADLRAVLVHVGIRRAAFVGSSNGGRIALEYALTYPDGVEALVLLAPGLPDHEWSAEKRLADEEEEKLFDAGDFAGAADGQVRFWVDGPGRGPDAVDARIREWVRGMILRSYELYAEAAQEGALGPAAWIEPPVSARLGEVPVPTLVVVGEYDAGDVHDIADRLEREIPGGRKVVVPDAAHVLPLEQPEELNRILLEFLAER
jgi:3-oxoadipate enol-lactonase